MKGFITTAPSEYLHILALRLAEMGIYALFKSEKLVLPCRAMELQHLSTPRATIRPSGPLSVCPYVDCIL